MVVPVSVPADSQTVCDVACTVCGCVCDDLEFDVVGRQITEIRGACELAEPWLLAANEARPAAAMIEGAGVAFEPALTKAAGILSRSRNPLIFGLSRSSTPGQRAAVHLAEQLGANIDTTASVCHGPSIMAIQQVGESTCSLGEIRNRADLVLFWGANPVESHPRHFERYSVDAAGLYVPRGRQDRTVVVIDTKPTATSAQADLFIQVAPERDFEVIWTLRQLIRGGEPTAPNRTGVPLDALQDLADRMMGCRFGAAFFGLGLARQGHGHLGVAALLQLVAELNAQTRFVARRLRLPGDVTGADSVLCWQTGFPFAVNMARGYPRYNPEEFSANEILTRGEADACLIVGSESLELLSSSARKQLQQLPTIVLDYPHVATDWQPTVRLTTAVYGLHAPGTIYRMDEVPLPLRQVVTSDYPTDADVLTRLRKLLS